MSQHGSSLSPKSSPSSPAALSLDVDNFERQYLDVSEVSYSIPHHEDASPGKKRRDSVSSNMPQHAQNGVESKFSPGAGKDHSQKYLRSKNSYLKWKDESHFEYVSGILKIHISLLKTIGTINFEFEFWKKKIFFCVNAYNNKNKIAFSHLWLRELEFS